MADQSVKITNLPDSGSRERVAYDLYIRLGSMLPTSNNKVDNLEKHLQLYEACLNVVDRGNPDVSNFR